MILAAIELTVPAVVVLTTLFGLLARTNPKPGGVALFFRVGLVGSLLGVALLYAVYRTGLSGPLGDAVVNSYRGLLVASAFLLAMAALGVVLKRGPG
jgi:hypothetical protein